MSLKRIALPVWLKWRSFLLARMPSGVASEIEANRIQRILVIRQDRMGDVILTSAMLPELRRLFPQAEIIYWIREPFLPLFDQPEGFSVTVSKPDGVFDLVIDPVLDYPLAGAKLAASFETIWTVGFDVAGRGRYFTHPVPPPNGDEPFLVSLGRLFVPFGVSDEMPAPSLSVTALERGNAREISGVTGEYVLVHPGAFYPSQRWPEAHVAAMIDRLTSLKIDVVVVGAASEQAILEDVRRRLQVPECVSFLCGEPLRMVMALMAEAAVVVCNNSGPLHLATALGVPTVSVLGPTNPKVWWPVGEKQTVLVAPGCDHCESGDCRRRCLEKITPDAVIEQIVKLVNIH
jgi:ADP-heptose:LPS heptosyltransferase